MLKAWLSMGGIHRWIQIKQVLDTDSRAPLVKQAAQLLADLAVAEGGHRSQECLRHEVVREVFDFRFAASLFVLPSLPRRRE